MPNLKHRLHEPRFVVCIGHLRELDFARDEQDGLHLGPLVTLTRLSRNDVVTRDFPSLAKAAGLVAGPQLRNMGTLGGNLCLDTRCTYYNQTLFWREALGYTRAEGFSFIMARIEVNFRAQALAGEALDVRIRIGRIGRSSFTFDYEIVRIGDGALIADGSSVQVMFDYAAQKSQPVTDAFRARASAFEQRPLPPPAASQ